MRTPTPIAVALSLILAACSSTPTLIPRDAPYWVSDGSRAVSNDEGKLFRGIGVAANISVENQRQKAAEGRAKGELAHVIEGFVAALSPKAKEANALPSPESQQAFVTTVLAKANAKETWDDGAGATYVLVELSLDALKKAAADSSDLGSKYLLLDSQGEEAFARYVDESKATVEAKAKLPEGTCVKALRFADAPKVDPHCGPIRAATFPGWLVYACEGGKGQARFGEFTFEGKVEADKRVEVTFGPAVIYQKGCTWKQTEVLRGTLQDGLRYERDQTLVSPSTDEDCPDSCNLESKVAIQ